LVDNGNLRMKSSSRSLALILLLALAGGVVAYVLWAGRASNSDGASSDPRDRTTSSSGNADLDAPRSVGANERVEARVPTASIDGGESGSARHVLVGRVVDDSARAVVSADVFLGEDAGSSGIPVERLDPQELAWARRSTAKTDELGRFRFERSATSNARLRVRAAGFVPHDAAVPVRSDPTIDLGDIVLRTGIVLSGRVLDSSRAAVVGARVRRLEQHAAPAATLRDSDEDVVAITDANGGFALADLAPGPWSLLVKAGDHPDKLERGTAEAGRPVSGVEIVLEDGAEIRGRIVHAPAEALATLWVRAIPVSDAPVGVLYAGDQVDPERFVVLPRGAHCSADGSFVVRGLSVGLDYHLSARVGEHDYFGPVRTGQVLARAGARDVELVYRAGTVLTFQVVDGATSQPVTDFVVRLGRGHPEPLANDDGSVRHVFADGRVRVVQGLDGGDEPLRLEVEARGYETTVVPDVRVAPGQAQDHGIVRLVPAAVVAVRVVDDATGAPVSGARVWLAADDPAPEPAASAPNYSVHAADSDEDGRVRLNALGGESVRLRARHPDFAPFRGETAGSFGIARDDVVRLRAGGTVVVEVRDARGVAVRGLRIRHASPVQDVLADEVRDPDRSRTDAEGRVVYTRLAPGEHTFELDVRRSASNSSTAASTGVVPDPTPRRVSVADGSTENVTWIVPTRGRTTGRVTANARGVSGATVRFTPRVAAGSTSDSAETLVARTNGNGDYVLSSVELGSYDVSVVHGSRCMTFETEVAIDELQHAFDIALPPTAIRGRIVDAEGRPLAGVRVHVDHAAAIDTGADADRSNDSAIQTDVDGAYLLDGVQGDVDLVVEARHPQFQTARSAIVRVATGETRSDVDLVLAIGAVLDVAVVRAGPACRVRATYADGSGATALDVVVSLALNSTARFTGLRPGTWRIRLEDCVDLAKADGAMLEQVVEIAPHRANSVRFELP